MKSTFIFISITSLFLCYSCSKKDDSSATIYSSSNEEKIDVSAQWLVDANGVIINSLNDGQWIDGTFSLEEMELFISLDTINLSGTSTPTEVLDSPSGFITTYPLPFESVNNLTLLFNSEYTGSVVFKAVIVDNKMKAKSKLAAKLNTQNAQASIALMPNIPDGKYRLYYTLSSETNPHFFKSWGNIHKTQ